MTKVIRSGYHNRTREAKPAQMRTLFKAILRDRWPNGMGPYNPWDVAKRIETRRVEKGVPVSRLVSDPFLAANGLAHKGGWSNKIHGIEGFTLIQISRLYVLLDGYPGWPFMPQRDSSETDDSGDLHS